MIEVLYAQSSLNLKYSNWHIFFVVSLTFDLEDCYRYLLKYRRIQPERELIHSQPVGHQERIVDSENLIFIILWYYVEACNELRGPSPRLSAWVLGNAAPKKHRNVGDPVFD